MKGLHNIREPVPYWTWRWYSAFQSRRGRRHLIRVPVLEMDLEPFINAERRRIPYAIRYMALPERRQWAETMTQQRRNLAIPSTVQPDVAQDVEDRHHAGRLCSGAQDARWYQLEATPLTDRYDLARPRGYCQTCWNAWNDRERPFRGAITETQWARGYAYLNQTTTQWEDAVRRDYRPT